WGQDFFSPPNESGNNRAGNLNSDSAKIPERPISPIADEAQVPCLGLLPRPFLIHMKTLFALLVIVRLALPMAQAAPASPPNILFIFSDDHAQHAISAHGS